MRSSCGDLQSQRHLVARHRRALWWFVGGLPLVNGPRSPIGSGTEPAPAEESVPQQYRLWVPGDAEATRRRLDMGL